MRRMQLGVAYIFFITFANVQELDGSSGTAGRIVLDKSLSKLLVGLLISAEEASTRVGAVSGSSKLKNTTSLPRHPKLVAGGDTFTVEGHGAGIEHIESMRAQQGFGFLWGKSRAKKLKLLADEVEESRKRYQVFRYGWPWPTWRNLEAEAAWQRGQMNPVISGIDGLVKSLDLAAFANMQHHYFPWAPVWK